MIQRLKAFGISQDAGNEWFACFVNLFEDSPIGLCLEDISEVKKYLGRIELMGISDLQQFLEKHPDEVMILHSRVKRLGANQAAASLFGFNTKDEFILSMPRIFNPTVFKQMLVAFYSGEMTFEQEVRFRNQKGEERWMIAKRVVVPGFEKCWSRSMVSYQDITERKSIELRLRQADEDLKILKSQLRSKINSDTIDICKDSHFSEFSFSSTLFKKVLEKVRLVAKTDASVLILGESGTGKELIARAIHASGNRSGKILVNVNCAALPTTLIESELFGHEKGAFTGATAQKTGRFELANGGTIFLDEIGELPIDVQAKLLRVLQEGEFERVGGTKPIKVNVRVISATNQDLQRSILENKFRADLYYRINVFPLQVPPLRHRKEDIPLLVNDIASRIARRLGREIPHIPKSIMSLLSSYNWPGNVRELENVIERGLILTEGNALESGDWLPVRNEIEVSNSITKIPLNDVERQHILNVLHSCSWKIRGQGGAAMLLNIKPTTLEARMKKLGIIRLDKATQSSFSIPSVN